MLLVANILLLLTFVSLLNCFCFTLMPHTLYSGDRNALSVRHFVFPIASLQGTCIMLVDSLHVCVVFKAVRTARSSCHYVLVA